MCVKASDSCKKRTAEFYGLALEEVIRISFNHSSGLFSMNNEALRKLAQRNVEWYSVHTNSVALHEMAQRYVEWYSVHKNSVALRRIALESIRRSS